MRYFVELSYKGTNFHGWQVQHNAPSVQEELNRAMEVLLRSAVSVTGAGRTDTGVHALQMFAHFDAQFDYDNDTLRYKLNGILPDDIAIRRIIPVKEGAHARFDALSRSYRYYIHQQKNPFLKETSWLLHKDLNLEAMNKAAALLFQYKDFTSFSKVKTQTKTNNCVIKEAKWEKNRDGLLFHVSADRFLRNMVRALVGTMVQVGEGKLGTADFEEVIIARDRRKAGPSAPAHGLFLAKVEYPSEIFEEDY